jgi:hypothetical protein
MTDATTDREILDAAFAGWTIEHTGGPRTSDPPHRHPRRPPHRGAPAPGRDTRARARPAGPRRTIPQPRTAGREIERRRMRSDLRRTPPHPGKAT